MFKKLENSIPYETFNTDSGKAIVAGSNVRLNELAEALVNVESLFNIDNLSVMPDDILNYIGFIFYGDFWSNLRDRQYRENLIMVSRLSIVTRGTQYCILRMIQAVTGFTPGVWLQSNQFRADYGMTDVDSVGNEINLFAWLTVPQTIPRNQFIWYEILDVIDYFAPVTTEIKPTFDEFYADISVADEPVFT